MKLTEICVHRVLPIGVAVLMAAGCLTSCRGSGAGGDTDTTTTTTSATTILSVNVSVDEQANATTTTPATKIVTVTKADGTVETKIVTETTVVSETVTTTKAKADKTTAKSSTTKSGAKQTTKTTAAPVVTTTKATTAAPTTKATAAPTTKAPTTTKKVTTTTTKATTTTTQAPTKCLNPGIWIESSTLDGGGVGPGYYLSCGKCAYCISTRITPAEMETWANAYMESLGMVIDYSDDYLPEVAAFLPPVKWAIGDAEEDIKEQVRQRIHSTIEYRELPKGTPVRCVVREVDVFDCDYWIYILH